MSTAHPLHLWLESKGLTYEQGAEMARRRGVRISASYLAQIAGGFYPCSYRLAKNLSLKLTRGEVDAVAIVEYAYRGRKAA